MASIADSVRLYFRLVGISLKSQMQYRASFILMTAGYFLITCIDFIGILVLFARFGTIRGWQLEEVAMFYGLINVGFALAEAFGRGFDKFDLQVVTGEFDRTLVRPRSTGLLVLAHDYQLLRVGRLIQGAAVLVWASINTGVAWNIPKILLLFVSVLGNIGVFTGLLVLQATMCFWSTKSLEVMNSFTSGGVEAVQWPLPIFKRWFAGVFVVIIPLACVNYFPVLAILEKADPLGSPAWFGWVCPVAGFLFILGTLLVWRLGVRHYHSTGS